jgi:predicted enzyme related to lactoylglutathione lyase
VSRPRLAASAARTATDRRGLAGAHSGRVLLLLPQEDRARPPAPPRTPRSTPTGNVGGPGYGAGMDLKLELVPVPVTDVDRAKAFYVEKVGFTADHDHQVNDELRFVQLTPPGSACSIVIGTGITDMTPGSQRGLQVVTDDLDAARKRLVDNGVDASEVDEQPWGHFVYFSDPDGNTWAIQYIPGRG